MHSGLKPGARGSGKIAKVARPRKADMNGDGIEPAPGLDFWSYYAPDL
jgi:hypothetical protein